VGGPCILDRMQQPGLDPWRPGATVGEYVLVRRLGAGGMGAVDLARHPATGALRAIKSLPASADPELLVRFQREGEALARVAQAGVVKVHTTGAAHGRVFLVMDHLAGGDLEARLRRGPLPAAEVRALGATLARALARVHALGVLHRDLKPANVLFDERGAPVLVDFGLARLTSAQTLTATGELLGTPAYMAPEQVRGEREGLGPATDVYGLGGLLFRALTGRPPFEGKTAMEVLTRVATSSPPSVASLVPGVPPALAAAIDRALASRPADRFPSAEAFAQALEARPAAARGRGRVIGAVLLVAGGALGLALALASSPPPPPPAPPPRRQQPAEPSRPDPTPAAAAPSDPRPASVAALISLGPAPHDFVNEASVVFGTPGELSFGGLERVVLSERGRRGDQRLEDRDGAWPRVTLAARSLAQLTQRPTDETGRVWLLLSDMFAVGEGVAPSDAEAARCLQEAAGTGLPRAITRLARARTAGELGLTPEPETDARRLRELIGTPEVETIVRDQARLALAELADLAPDVVDRGEGLAALEQMTEKAPAGFMRTRLMRTRLMYRHGERGPMFDLNVGLLVDARSKDHAKALRDLAGLLARAPEEEQAEWRSYVLRRARDGTPIWVLILNELQVRGEVKVADELVGLLEPIARGEGSGGSIRAARIALHRQRLGGARGSVVDSRELLLREEDGRELLAALEKGR
jgi:serine/threonine protein kinase